MYYLKHAYGHTVHDIGYFQMKYYNKYGKNKNDFLLNPINLFNVMNYDVIVFKLT